MPGNPAPGRHGGHGVADLARTGTDHAPWVHIDFNSKHKGRIDGFKTIEAALAKGVDLAWPDVSPAIHDFFGT